MSVSAPHARNVIFAVSWSEVLAIVTIIGVVVGGASYLIADHEQSAATARRVEATAQQMRDGFRSIDSKLDSVKATMADQYAVTNSRLGSIEGALRSTKAASLPVTPVGKTGLQ